MIRNNQKPQIVTRWECFIKIGPPDGTTIAARTTEGAGGGVLIQTREYEIWFSLMNRSVILPDHHSQPSSKAPSKSLFFLNNGHLHFICWKEHLAAVFSCPSVYLSFIPEAQTAGKWINKDWAKIGSGCVCSGGMLAASALTASLSPRTEWRERAAELAGR